MRGGCTRHPRTACGWPMSLLGLGRRQSSRLSEPLHPFARPPHHRRRKTVRPCGAKNIDTQPGPRGPSASGDGAAAGQLEQGRRDRGDSLLERLVELVDRSIEQATAVYESYAHEVYVPAATNDGSAFAHHVVPIWTVGQYTYAVGFHDVSTIRRTLALDLSLARTIKLVRARSGVLTTSGRVEAPSQFGAFASLALKKL